MSFQKLKYADFYYCQGCGDYCDFQDIKTCCRNPYIITKQHEISGGVQLRHQCASCGCIGSQAVKKASVDSWQRLEFSDKEKNERYQTERFSESNERRQSYRQWAISIKQDEKYAKYQSYLLTPEWREKRSLVLKRDNNTCTACGINEATEVHHINYDHLYNEPLFELQSVCNPCHKSISNMDKGLEFIPIQHQTITLKKFA